MFCKECRAEGKRNSRVEIPNTVTISPDGQTIIFRDEQNNYHRHSSITLTDVWHCNHGHSWTETRLARCPCANCEWNDLDFESRIKSAAYEIRVKEEKVQEKMPSSLNIT